MLVPLRPPVKVPFLLHAHTPRETIETQLLRVANCACEGAKVSKIGVNATESVFCSIPLATKSTHIDENQTRQHATNPVKSTIDAKSTNKHKKIKKLDKNLKVWYTEVAR